MVAQNSCYYGYLSGAVTALALQPLDNIKMTLIIPPSKLQLSSNFAKNIYLTTKYIHLQQGFLYFYRGLIVNLWKTGLGSAIYFYTLRNLQKIHNNHKTSVQNFIASSLARIIGTIVTNPLAVAQTRYQLPEKQGWKGSTVSNFIRMYQNQGIYSLFKGCYALCLKQAGFAGLYYSFYVKGKQNGYNSAISGMGAGLISTLLTHPLQIIRTSTQAIPSKNRKISIYKQFINLIKQGRIFDGVAPRLIKKPAANTIGFLLFEYFEKSTMKII